MAQRYVAMKKLPSSLRCLALLLATFCRSTPPADSRSASPFTVADSLQHDGRFREAVPIYRALRDSLAGAHDTAGYWRAELWLSQMLWRTRQRDSATAAVEQAMLLARGNAAREGWTYWGECSIWSGRGMSDSAVTACSRSLALSRAIPDHELEAMVHFMLGTINSRLGHFRESVGETEQALLLERRYGRSRHQLAGTLNSMGIEYASVGRLGEAEQMYREGLALSRTFATPWTTMYLNSNLADLRASVGDINGAIALMKESLRGGEELADTQPMVYALNGLAQLYLRENNRPAARSQIERSLAMSARVHPLFRTIALWNLGLIQAADSQTASATHTLSSALALADSSGFDLQRVNVRTGLARVAASSGHLGTALRWADAALRIADSMEAPEAQLDALEARASVLEAARRSDASNAYLQALALLESWRGRLALGDLRMEVAEPRWSVYEGAIRTLFAGGDSVGAFAVAERARARLLLELMAERDASQPTTSRSATLRRQLSEEYVERGSVEDARARATLDRTIEQLTDSLKMVESVERASEPGGAARYPTPAPLPSLRVGLLGPGRALLSFFWGEREVYGWWITDSAVHAARLGSPDSLAAMVDFLRSAVDDPSTGSIWEAPAARAFQKFIAPLAPDTAPEILIVPDGPLAYIPFEVLIPETGAPPWGATHRVIYGPSASVLLALGQTRRPSRWKREMLAVGNPRMTQGATHGEQLRAVLVRNPADLPYAEEEARSIGALFGPGADLLLGRNATLQHWFKSNPSQYRYLHFAAHTEVSERGSDSTDIILSGGRLDLPAIRRLELESELVTLSACETALGHRLRGEGIVGLPHAFLAAGAHGAVVTLWRIGDRSAADFMRDFYRELHRGRSPADALLIVRQRWSETRGPERHPSRWAAFILVGGN